MTAVAACAEIERNRTAKTANENVLSFIRKISFVEQAMNGITCRMSRHAAQGKGDTLNAKIVFESKDRTPIPEPRSQFANRYGYSRTQAMLYRAGGLRNRLGLLLFAFVLCGDRCRDAATRARYVRRTYRRRAAGRSFRLTEWELRRGVLSKSPRRDPQAGQEEGQQAATMAELTHT